MKLLLLLAALAAPIHAEEGAQVFPLPLFKDGLYTRYSANAIPDGALSEALNVLIDQDVDGVVVARNGYSKYNTTAITDPGTGLASTIRGLWSFDASDGTKYIVAHSSMSFYKSSGDGSWTQIVGLTGLSLTKDFDCVQTIGSLYCGNGDVIFSWNGTSTATISGAPLGNLLGRFRNRLLISGVSGSKANLKGSGELDATDWTLQVPGVSTTPFSIPFGGVDDGEDITCLMGAFQDVFIVGKRQSLWGLYGFGRADFQVRELSREVGCIENRSVREKNNCLYWMSLRGIEKFCGANIERIGDPIRDKIDTIVATAGNARSALDTTQADFEAGDLTASGPGAPISATISAGSIVPSSSSFVDSSTASFARGSFTGSTVTFHGLEFSGVTSTYTYRYEGAALPDAEGWTKSLTGGSCSEAVSASTLTVNCVGTVSEAPVMLYTKSLGGITDAGKSIVFRASIDEKVAGASANAYRVGFADDSSGLQGYVFIKQSAIDYIGPSGLTMKTEAVTQPSYSTFTLIVSTPSGLSFWRDGVFRASTTFAPSNATKVFMRTSAFFSGNIYSRTDFIYVSSGSSNIGVADIPAISTFVSRIFDTQFSTPTAGEFISTETIPSGTATTYQVRDSTSPNNDMWDSYESVTPPARPLLATKRYWQYKITLKHANLVESPGVTGANLGAATTGYFISQCRNPSTAITSWGLFTCNQSLNDGDLTYYISTGTTCNSVTRTTATWNTQANNAPIAIDTAAYVAYRVLFSVDSGTEAPQVQDCTINWNEGETRPPVASQVYRDRYYLAYTSSTATGSSNDHLLVLDKNDKWTLFDNHRCYSLALYNRNLYCGSSTDVGQVWLLDQGTDDDGTAIFSKVRTKAFHLGLPESRKKFKKLYLDLEPSPSQSITLTARYTLERSSPTYSLSTVDLNEDPGSILTPKFPFALTNPVTGRYIQLELESSALNSPWRLFGGRLYYSPLPPE